MSDLKNSAPGGVPSLVWRAGQERRLRMILEAADGRERGWVLDNGCGVGAYLARLAPLAQAAFGLEPHPEHAAGARQAAPNITSGRGERLPFADGAFDLVLSHEVLEHVADQREALAEMIRALRRPGSSSPGGRLVLFVPNRGYPFETHGIYWRGKYRFGNFPFVNYLPSPLRDRLAPHVRAYTANQLGRMVAGLPARVVSRTLVYGGYDNLIARWPRMGRLLRATLQALEHTPLRRFGLSHLWVLERS